MGFGGFSGLGQLFAQLSPYAFVFVDPPRRPSRPLKLDPLSQFFTFDI